MNHHRRTNSNFLYNSNNNNSISILSNHASHINFTSNITNTMTTYNVKPYTTLYNSRVSNKNNLINNLYDKKKYYYEQKQNKSYLEYNLNSSYLKIKESNVKKVIQQNFPTQEIIIKKLKQLMLDVNDINIKIFLSKTMQWIKKEIQQKQELKLYKEMLQKQSNNINQNTMIKNNLYSTNLYQQNSGKTLNNLNITSKITLTQSKDVSSYENNNEKHQQNNSYFTEINKQLFQTNENSQENFFKPSNKSVQKFRNSLKNAVQTPIMSINIGNTQSVFISQQQISQKQNNYDFIQKQNDVNVSKSQTIQCQCGLFKMLIAMIEKLISANIISKKTQNENDVLEFDQSFIQNVTKQIIDKFAQVGQVSKQKYKVQLEEFERNLQSRSKKSDIQLAHYKQKAEQFRLQIQQIKKFYDKKIDNLLIQNEKQMKNIKQKYNSLGHNYQKMRNQLKKDQEKIKNLMLKNKNYEEQIQKIKKIQTKDVLKDIQIQRMKVQIQLKQKQINQLRIIVEVLEKQKKQLNSQKQIKILHNLSQQDKMIIAKIQQENKSLEEERQILYQKVTKLEIQLAEQRNKNRKIMKIKKGVNL